MTAGLNRRVPEDYVPSTPLSSETQEKGKAASVQLRQPSCRGALLGVAAATRVCTTGPKQMLHKELLGT